MKEYLFLFISSGRKALIPKGENFLRQKVAFVNEDR